MWSWLRAICRSLTLLDVPLSTENGQLTHERLRSDHDATNATEFAWPIRDWCRAVGNQLSDPPTGAQLPKEGAGARSNG
jgi:hypothetical protein